MHNAYILAQHFDRFIRLFSQKKRCSIPNTEFVQLEAHVWSVLIVKD